MVPRQQHHRQAGGRDHGRCPVKDVLRERLQAGCSVIMTTHILDVAERMADRIGVIANGRLVADGTLDELRHQTGSGQDSLEDTFLALVAQEETAA